MFKRGDKVQFIDKYGIHQKGIFEGMETVPWGTGTKRVGIVVCKAFADLGDDRDVRCMIPNPDRHLWPGHG